MGGRCLAVRILGIAATIRGFAYALTEGPGCLVDVNTRRRPAEKADVAKALASVLAASRPLFVAFGSTKARRGTRAAVLDEVLTAVCKDADVMILRISRQQLAALTQSANPTKWDVAQAVAIMFPEIAHRLPRQPSIWEAENDSIGMFEATAAATAAWYTFRRPRLDDS